MYGLKFGWWIKRFRENKCYGEVNDSESYLIMMIRWRFYLVPKINDEFGKKGGDEKKRKGFKLLE